MSLKHNPFDNSYKGNFVRRKKVFESPTPEELAVKANPVVSSSSVIETSLEQQQNISKTETETTLEQLSNITKTEDLRFRNIIKTEPKTVLVTSLEQHSHITKTVVGFSAVVGLQRKILDYFFTKAQSLGSRTTGKIYPEVLAEMLACSVETVRTSVQRLETKGFVVREEFKRGRGGFSVFKIGVETYQNLVIENNTKTSFKQNENITSSQTKTEPKTSPPCSSSIVSSLEIKETTTTDQEFWLSVPKNLDGLVSVKQLRDFVKQGLVSPEDLQSSLDGFAFDLEKSLIRAKNGNPIAILIGAIKGGGYISQQYLTELKASLAEIEKARAELYQLQAENLAERLRQEFDSFRAQYPDQAERLRPGGAFINSFEPGSVGYRMWLEEYKKNLQTESVVEA